jgi:hypothetical protein
LRAHDLAAQCLAQIGDQVLHGSDRGLWRLSGPQLLDQAVGGDHLTGIEHQQRQEGALLSPFQLERTSLHPDLERPEDAKLDFRHQCGSTTVFCRWLERE